MGIEQVKAYSLIFFIHVCIILCIKINFLNQILMQYFFANGPQYLHKMLFLYCVFTINPALPVIYMFVCNKCMHNHLFNGVA